MTNYMTFKSRILKADKIENIVALHKSLDRLYNAGVFQSVN